MSIALAPTDLAGVAGSVRNKAHPWSWLQQLWCAWTHPTPMWPIHGYYVCPQCMRKYPVPWANQ
jgi:hypothetical protein